MCGIVGYVGSKPVQDILLEGLKKLEYRGYDSAGISMLADGEFQSVRAVGNLGFLREALITREDEGEGGGVAVATRPATTGIGHTRWATHGRVTQENAHPHFDNDDRVHVVVNGIVENYLELKQGLVAEGAVFTSETDAEVIAHLVSRELERCEDLVEAVRTAYNRLRGHYAFVAVCVDDPDLLVAARKECPLVIGRGDGEQFIGSAIPAFLAHTRDVQLIENGEIVAVRPDGVDFFVAATGEPVRAGPSRRSSGTPPRPRRAASRRSRSRRSTSRPTRSRRRSPTARCATTASTSATSARSTTRCWPASSGSSSSLAARRITPA